MELLYYFYLRVRVLCVCVCARERVHGKRFYVFGAHARNGSRPVFCAYTRLGFIIRNVTFSQKQKQHMLTPNTHHTRQAKLNG